MVTPLRPLLVNVLWLLPSDHSQWKSYGYTPQTTPMKVLWLHPSDHSQWKYYGYTPQTTPMKVLWLLPPDHSQWKPYGYTPQTNPSESPMVTPLRPLSVKVLCIHSWDKPSLVTTPIVYPCYTLRDLWLGPLKVKVLWLHHWDNSQWMLYSYTHRTTNKFYVYSSGTTPIECYMTTTLDHQWTLYGYTLEWLPMKVFWKCPLGPLPMNVLRKRPWGHSH